MSDEDKVVEEEEEKTTLSYAIGLVNRSGKTFTDWRIKGLGLQLTLLGLAEVQAERVDLLSRMVVKLEKNLFSDVKISEMRPDQLLSLYRNATDSLQKSTEYVQHTLKSVDWTKLETDLLAMHIKNENESNSDPELANIAHKILGKLAELKEQGSTKVEVENDKK